MSKHSPSLETPPAPVRLGIGGRLRTYLLAGIVVTAPVGITFYVGLLFVEFIDNQVHSLIPEQYALSNFLPFEIPGLGVIVLLIVLLLVGFFTANLLGRFLVRFGERIIERVPVVRSVYGALKQIFETVFSDSSSSFREVVLIEYPRRGIWAVGFITGTTKGEVQSVTDDEMANVFLPTTPNPTSGFLLFVPRSDVVHLSMTVEEGIKMVISAGIVTPPDPATRPSDTPEPGPASK